MNSYSLTLFGSVLLITGCFTPNKERQLNADIYKLQQRTFQLEKKLAEKSGQTIQTEATKKTIATTSSSIEKLEVDIQRLTGQIDALRVGIRTGQIPGEEPEEGTLAQIITDLQARIETIEEAQTEILAAIRGTNKKAESSSSNTSSSSTKTPFQSVLDLSAAFEKKQYPRVVEEAPALAKATKSKADKEKILFLEAESLYKLGKLRDAALKYSDFIEAYPKTKQLAHAKLRMGDCFRHLGDKATSKVYYEELVSEFPETEEARTAQNRLEKLGKSG